jgi:hypothetical protein
MTHEQKLKVLEQMQVDLLEIQRDTNTEEKQNGFWRLAYDTRAQVERLKDALRVKRELLPRW